MRILDFAFKPEAVVLDIQTGLARHNGHVLVAVDLNTFTAQRLNGRETFWGSSVGDLTLSPSGRYLAVSTSSKGPGPCGGDSAASVLDLETGELRTLPVTELSAPDGKRIVSYPEFCWLDDSRLEVIYRGWRCGDKAAADWRRVVHEIDGPPTQP